MCCKVVDLTGHRTVCLIFKGRMATEYLQVSRYLWEVGFHKDTYSVYIDISICYIL